MQRVIHAFAGPLALAALAACAGARPVPPYFQGADHPTYDKKKYFLAGASGDSPESAAANAKAAVAAQVSSQLSSTLEDIQRSVSSGAGTSEAQSIESRVQIKAEFKHAELIKVVEQFKGGDPELHWALAVLDRGEAARTLEAELAPTMDEFNRAVDAALKAAKEKRLKALFASRAEVAEKYKAVLATGIMPQLAVVRGGAYGGLQKTRSMVDEVERAVRDARSTLVGLVVTRNEPGSDPEQQKADLAIVEEALAKSFQSLGIKVETLKGLGDITPESPGELKSRDNAIVALVDVKATARQSEMGLGVYFAYSNARVRLFRPATSELLSDFSVGGGATKAGHRDAPRAVQNSIKYLLKQLNEKLEAELASLR